MAGSSIKYESCTQCFLRFQWGGGIVTSCQKIVRSIRNVTLKLVVEQYERNGRSCGTTGHEYCITIMGHPTRHLQASYAPDLAPCDFSLSPKQTKSIKEDKDRIAGTAQSHTVYLKWFAQIQMCLTGFTLKAKK